MADIDRFHQIYSYLADKPDLDVTEAMGFDPSNYQFKLVTKETTSISLRGPVETARAIGLVVSNNLNTNGGVSEHTSTELYAISPPGFDTEYLTFIEYGINGEVLDVHKRGKEDFVGVDFEQGIVPPASINLAHESAFVNIEQAVEAHRESLSPVEALPEKPSSTKTSLLDAARSKRIKIAEDKARDLEEKRQLAKQELIAQKEKMKQKQESDQKASEFINLMIANGVDPVNFVRYKTRHISTVRAGGRYDKFTYIPNFETTYAIDTELIGKGWVIKSPNSGRGYILLTNGVTYECSRPFDTVKNMNSSSIFGFAGYKITGGDGLTLLLNAENCVSEAGIPHSVNRDTYHDPILVESPYHKEDFVEYLTNTIVNLGLDKTTEATDSL